MKGFYTAKPEFLHIPTNSYKMPCSSKSCFWYYLYLPQI